MNWVASEFPICYQTQLLLPYKDNYNSPTDDYFFREQKGADKNFFKKFETNSKNRKNIHQVKSFKTSEEKFRLFQIIKEKESIKNLVYCLSGTEDSFENQFSILKERIIKLNNKIIIFQRNTKLNINKNIKKRRRFKNEKLRLKEIKKMRKILIQEKHKVMEKLLSEKTEEIDKIKTEVGLKRQADLVLQEVRKKKFEAKKMMNLLSALKQLRELRNKEEEDRGGFCSKPLTDTFNQVMERFQSLWEKQTGIYELEEKGLKIMLEANSPTQVKKSYVVNNILEWEKVLFGKVSFFSKYEKVLTAANNDFNVMIQVRKDWDQFLAIEQTPMASNIPPGWVIPLDKYNNMWNTHFI